MSILNRPYEISVWEDVWDTKKGTFVEKRICAIGADSMEYQGRAIEPTLTTNVNGTKKFTFKMYKKFVDNVTGQQINNPFSEWLVSERKVKLYYNNKWYDFVIKNLEETNDVYLYSYTLEDAWVQELSKNGFNVVLDDSQNNNLGNVETLAKNVLVDTDWEVESEKFVQLIEDSLVYLVTTQPIQAIPINDSELQEGCKFGDPVEIEAKQIILGFYSSCTSKPHRFQFIYLNKEKPLCDDHGILINKNCQYYIDIESPQTKYWSANKDYNFSLPKYFDVCPQIEDETGENSVLISGKYRGKRIGFTQQTKFIPALNRYVSVYETKDKDGNTQQYYGYQNSTYISPTLIQNVISDPDFEREGAWTAARLSNGGSIVRPTIVPSYGWFDENGFNKAIDNMSSIEGKNLSNYLELNFQSTDAAVINFGPRDYRTTIKHIEPDEEWVLAVKYSDTKGNPLTGKLGFHLGEYEYDSETDSYTLNTEFVEFEDAERIMPKSEYQYFKFRAKTVGYSEQSFKQESKIGLSIFPLEEKVEVYLEHIELFKAVYKNGQLMLPDEQVKTIEDGVIDQTYYYFTEESLDGVTEPDQLIPDFTEKELTYTKFKPVYNKGAEKVRSIQAKESNYFNILQTICETFEAWLELEVTRNEDGSIDKKIARFKNYIGNTNLAGFRYGVNLKNIKRTFESKNIVTKLLVKPNSNEFAKNGFCTISRAAANPTGESYIYDFQYFHNTGMLNARNYIDVVYSLDGASGEDIQTDTEWNINGYFLRIKDLNNKINEQNNLLLNISQDLLKLEADYQVAEAGKVAATEKIEKCRNDIWRLTQKQISELNNDLRKRDDVQSVLQKYVLALQQEKEYTASLEDLTNKLDEKAGLKKRQAELQEAISKFTEYKGKLNKLFFQKYFRFIQEGTWISEEYSDDEKYYADALSTMYNSCYPQVQYSLDVIEIGCLEGYEDYNCKLGDKTFIEDPEFFGADLREEVITTELSEDLDDPTKTKIKIQNYKNQFQDLFQKITATTQQVQYNAGKYEKAVALTEATQQRKQQFLSDALDGATARLTAGGNHTVTWGNDGITIQKEGDAGEMLRLISGAILFSQADPKTGATKWVTGITPEGVSADKITSGSIDTGKISLMDYKNELFRWDKFGISAFAHASGEGVTSVLNKNQFVRFDQYGLYGINGKDGTTWHATSVGNAEENATFALTWEGLKVTGNNVIAKIGKDDNNIINITKNSNTIFSVGTDGLTVSGNISGSTISGSTFKNEEGTIYLSTTGKSWTDSKGKERWVIFQAGDNFGVTETGDLYASGGEIAGWTIKKDRLNSEGVGVAGFSGDDSYVFWAGFKDTSSSHNFQDPFDYAAHAKGDNTLPRVTDLTSFYVLGDGSFKASKGTFGPWTLSSEGLSATNIKTNVVYGKDQLIIKSIDTTFQASIEFDANYESRGMFQITGASLRNCTSDKDLSDLRFKNSIEVLIESYDKFFDCMEPVRYKYNDGTSNRYHTGFVAQQLVEALEKSGLTTQDFAGVVLHYPGTEKEVWSLRRDEFVSLNTWQIQKLKPRMTAAEEKIQQLEQEIIQLKNEITALKQ